MPDERATLVAASAEPEVDENGVDLAQIRAMLELTPAERLSRVTAFASALVAMRARNDRARSD